jgi:DNA-binding winged helix-turn-helix (wHTH) protein/tetratricopeptide (TPR) repeat protein
MRNWLHFGPYRLDVVSPGLFRDGEPVCLTPKALGVLRLLAEAGGEVVTKEMLLDQVWAGTFVEESSVTKNVSELRSALGPTEDGALYIETFPRRGYRFSVPVRHVSDGVAGRKTLAVLPFRHLGPVREDDSFGLRIADSVITKLATGRSFTVRPTAAVFRYGMPENGRATAGRDLNVDFVLDGSIQECGGTFRTTVQLIEVQSQEPVWGATLDQGIQDDLAIETALAEELAGALSLFVSTEQRDLLSRRYTDQPKAYQLYLRGRFHWAQRSKEGLKTAIRLFHKAIALDPEYALAYSGLSAAYALLPMLTAGRARQFMPKARMAALKALDLDEALVEARLSLAMVKWHYDFDWRWAEREFTTSMTFQPDNAMLHHWYALLLAEMGRSAEAVAEVRKAQALDPESANIRANVASVLFFAGRYTEAITEAEGSLALDAKCMRGHLMLGASLEQIGRLEEAIRVYGDALRLSPESALVLGRLGHAYGAARRSDEALSVLHRLRRRRQRYYFFEEAMVEVGLGDEAASLASLERAYEEREFALVMLRKDPRFGPLSGMAGFQAILDRIGLGGS